MAGVFDKSSQVMKTMPRAIVERFEECSKRTRRRSASRHDLVRYSAATRDFNPLHWDHEFAVDAGLPSTVVHGLLMYAWLMQEASRATRGSTILSAKIRFRSALRPAEQAVVSTSVNDETVRVELSRGDEQLITGTATVASPTE